MSAATQARALIKAILNGNLSQVTHTAEVMRLAHASKHLPVAHAPITEVSTVQVGTSSVLTGDTDGWTFTPFQLVRTPGYHWPAGVNITVTYKTGWPAGDEPEVVQEAIALATAWFDTNPAAGVSSFSAGGESVSVDHDRSMGLIKSLLRRWVNHAL